MDIGAYLGKKWWIQGHILGEITDLEVETHGFLNNHVFLPTEQPGRKYMLNGISRRKFQDVSQLVWLVGKHTVKSTHCALLKH